MSHSHTQSRTTTERTTRLCSFDYEALRERVESAPPRVIGDWAEFAHPYQAPAEPAWPAPLDLRSAELSELRDRLGWDAWRVCLWTAADMALALFRLYAWRRAEADSANPREATAHPSALPVPRTEPSVPEPYPRADWMVAAQRVVAEARAVLWEASHPLDLYEAATEFFLIEHETLPQPGRYAWFAIRNALHGWTGGVRHFVQAWLAAHRMDPADRAVPSRVFDAWWQRCRCRLAFVDAAYAHTSEDLSGHAVQTVVTRAIASRHPRRSDASSLVLHWLNKSGDGRGTAPSPDGPASPPDEGHW